MKKLILLVTLLVMGCSVEVDQPTPIDSVTAAPEPTPEPVQYPTVPVVDDPPAKPKAKPLPPIRVWISPSVEYQKEVKAAVAAWQETTQGVREWVMVEATGEEITDADIAGKSLADVAIYEIGPYGGTCGGDGEGTSGALGCVQGIGGLWDNRSGQAMGLFLIDTTFSADGHAQNGYQQNPKLVAMHEMGHLLGLTHKDGGIMAAGATKAALAADWECPDAETVDRLETKLKISGLHACALPDGI